MNWYGGKERWDGRGGYRVGMSWSSVPRWVALNSEQRHTSPGDIRIGSPFSIGIESSSDFDPIIGSALLKRVNLAKNIDPCIFKDT